MKKLYINRIANILNTQTLSTIMMIIMMVLGGCIQVYAQSTGTEKVIYSTDFQDWKKETPDTLTQKVEKKTRDGQSLTFSLHIITCDPTGTDEAKFTNPGINLGFLKSEKLSEQKGAKEAGYIETSIIKNVTKVKFTQAATGGNTKRGFGLYYRREGETEWTKKYITKIQNFKGEVITVDINQDNVQLRFENLSANDFAFIIDLEISGKVEPVNQSTVTYYDTDGTTVIGTQTITKEASSDAPKLTYKYGKNDIKVSTGTQFRGWYNGIGEEATKIPEGTELLDDISIYAKVTPIEYATDGSEFAFNFNHSSWYVEDHDIIAIENGSYKDRHGWIIKKDGRIKLQVAKQAVIDVIQCNSEQSGTITITDSEGNTISSFTPSGATTNVIYSGDKPTTLTFTFSEDIYIHGLSILNFPPVFVSFRFPTDQIVGKLPETIRGNARNEVTLPTNHYFYRKGWTFVGWSDGTNIYEGGKTEVFDKTTVLAPKMTRNQEDITDTNSPAIATWNLDTSKAPVLNATNGEEDIIYTNSITIEGEKQDIAMTINTQNGRIENNNSGVNGLQTNKEKSAEGALVGKGTIFTVPAVYGMQIDVHASEKYDTNNGNYQTFFGEGADKAKISVSNTESSYVNITPSKDGKTLTLKYTGEESTLAFTIQDIGNQKIEYGYIKDITVTYPVLPNVVSENVIADKDLTKYPNEEGNDKNAGTAYVEASKRRPNTGNRFMVGDEAIIYAIPSYGYKVKGYKIKGSDSYLESKTYTNPETQTTYQGAACNVTDGITTIEVEYEHQDLYKVSVASSDKTLGTVSLSPKHTNFYQEIKDEDGNLQQVVSWYTLDTEVTASGEAKTKYIVGYWTEDESEEHKSDNNTYTFKIATSDTAGRNVIAHFEQGEIGTVHFKITSAHVNGSTPAYKDAESLQPSDINKAETFTVPTNFTFFKNVDDNDAATANNYTLEYWEDEENSSNHYELGNTYSFRKQELTLVPHFSYNPATQTNRLNNPVIRYDFGRQVVNYDDPTSKETRRVCAQAVNIGNNEKPFWTTRVYVEVLQDGQQLPHWRDVTMWCDTGKTGYIKNTDLNNWCAMGPGTTFWFASGAGTKISMLSYSKLTTTTIDGVVPTLDEQRTAEERQKEGSDHLYVYSYTTQSASLRLPIVIGDDYTYFKWFEMATLSANMVNLHVAIDNDQHGTIKNVTTKSEYGEIPLEDGGYSFRQGDRVTLSLERKFGYELDGIVNTEQLDKDGNPRTVLKIDNAGKVWMVGQEDNSALKEIPMNEDGSWGISTGTAKTLFTLKATEPSGDNAKTDNSRTTYEVEFDITAHRNMQINFKEKPTYYITYNPGNFAEGIGPAAEWVEEGDKYTIPQNRTLYYEGNTLDHWVDGDYQETMTAEEIASHTYRIGEEYTAPAKDVRLYPVFVSNGNLNILNLQKEETATWNFRPSDGAPSINYEKTAGILVSQLDFGDGKKIDLKIDLNGKNGKFNNEKNNRIQINSGSIIKFPSTPDCVVSLVADNGDPSSSITVAGKKSGDEGYTFNSQGKSISVTCDGKQAIQEATFSGNINCDKFMVTYKPQTVNTQIVSLTCAGITLDKDQIQQQMAEKRHITFKVAPWKYDKEEIPELTGIATEGGSISITKATLLSPEAVVNVCTASGVIVATYPVNFEFETPTTAPQFEKMTINGKDYNIHELLTVDAPRSGVISLTFNRSMAATSITQGNQKIEGTNSGKTITFKYWDLEEGENITFNISPNDQVFTDIYGKVCEETFSLTLHIVKQEDSYQHHTFDFIVGKDGDINEAMVAANNNTKSEDERYYIFIPDGEYHLMGLDEEFQNNEKNTLQRPNISMIGQSKAGTILWNKPTQAGLRLTGTIHLDKTAKDFYAQDLTLENRFNYWGGSTNGDAQAAAFHDQGQRTIMKNVALWSYQDTYYSNNATLGYRAYFEDSDIAGVVDFLCGDGDIWLEKCNIILRDRGGNNIAAPAQGAGQLWGYVFNNCTIKPETENPQLLKENDWTLGRPWNDSPACTYLNTRMYTQPKITGWGRMNTDMVLRFHEYRSMNADGILLSLGSRSLSASSPGAGSHDVVLSEEQANQYTIRNVMGGDDAFEPNVLCRQIDAASGFNINTEDVEDPDDRVVDTENHTIWQDNLVLDDDVLQWDLDNKALCYFLFKQDENGKWIYKANTAENQISLTQFGSGTYCVRAANQRGGLGAPTTPIEYEVQDPYELTIKQTGNLTGDDGKPCGWTTICLPFNAKVPEGITVYAATAHNGESEEDKVSDYLMTMTPVKVIDAEKGYVVYGPVGTYSFMATSRECEHQTILSGNPMDEPISTVNQEGYVLAYRTWGLGFYKFTGSTYAPYRAWLPINMVTDNVQEGLSTKAQRISLVFADDATAIHLPSIPEAEEQDTYYNLSGQKIPTPSAPGIYIERGKGKVVKK